MGAGRAGASYFADRSGVLLGATSGGVIDPQAAIQTWSDLDVPKSLLAIDSDNAVIFDFLPQKT